MVPVSQTIRANVMELRTNNGRIYVTTSGWARLYLLWTFRNFHHLPKQVLNHRQQQVIEQLCRRAVVSLDGPIARARIMGVVENMSVLPHRESATMIYEERRPYRIRRCVFTTRSSGCAHVAPTLVVQYLNEV
jgi:hypothetical protein